jgi:hypothetical protein
MTASGPSDGDASADQVLEQIRMQALVCLDEPSLDALLQAADIVRDDDTCLSGRIRILSLGGLAMVQEQTPEGEILIRRIRSLEAAQSFVDDRLGTYERMWDGCGCKVDYNHQPEDP